MRAIAAWLFAFGLLAPATGLAQPRSTPASAIAYISVQRILTESTQAKAAAKQLEDLRQAKAQEIAAKQKALEETRLQLANAGGIFAASTRTKLRAQESQQQSELLKLTQDSQNELQNLQRQLQADLRREFSGIVTEVAGARAIQIVLNGDNALIWAAPGTVDLTGQVLERLNTTAQKPTAK
jgi:Skp family chaperone for outer membrane proteins